MIRNILVVVAAIGLMTACTSAKKKAELANPKPAWIESRPLDSYSYTGIGIARKWGTTDNYKADARDKALADMAAQINSQISTSSVLYQVEDKQGVSEMLASNIRSSSKEFLEGYEMVDEWQDETNYYVFYKLSRSQFAELKEKRRQTAANLALTKYQAAQAQQNSNQTAGALLLYVQVLEALGNYLGESNISNIDGIDVDLASASLKNIKSLINGLHLKPVNPEVTVSPGQTISDDKLSFILSDLLNNPQPNIPVAFTFSGGYLRKDNSLSDAQGMVGTAIHQTGNGTSSHKLCAKVDVVNLIRQLTRDLLVRKLIDGTAGNSACISIAVK
jgi:hypothetical protein